MEQLWNIHKLLCNKSLNLKRPVHISKPGFLHSQFNNGDTERERERETQWSTILALHFSIFIFPKITAMGLYNLWPWILVWLGQTKKRLFNESPSQSSLMATIFGTRTWGHLTSLGTTVRSKQRRHWRMENIHPMLEWTSGFVFPSSLLAFLILPPSLGLCRPHSISFFTSIFRCLNVFN